ncbi:DUF421 domain-containing protein [Fervidibacillus albus]|uniref:DUF421 domain-containing protein n=1 Tax=Fervidibacillus albus TaxID=2980026 RepID=A0A9E8LVH9_9BACI|nr:DUF421 domain-containing protein [Fervidibacillus albus]WAA10266.1 DUF421 domain-containing protein [Fervidibacillus albus]
MIYGTIIVRTIILYGVITIAFRLMGKREVGELGIIDLVVFVMIAEMAVMSIENSEESMFRSLVPIVVLFIIQFFSSFFSLKSRRFRQYVDGEPSIIIKDGKINEKEMRKQRYNFDDLLMQLRQKDIWNLHEVKYAFLEPTGRLSILKKEDEQNGFAIPLILDGKLQREKLKEIGKSETWLFERLKEKGYRNIDRIAICNYVDGQLFIDEMDE